MLFRRIALVVIRLYQALLSPFYSPCCRFSPSCSHYAIDAINTHGIFRGSMLALGRILRCNPFGGHGHDPVPTTTAPTRIHKDSSS